MPQPIDPNSELGRLTAVERIQQIADRASLTAQHRTALEAQAQLLNQETQVLQTDQKNEEIDAELRRRTPFGGRRKRGEPEDEADPESAAQQAAEREIIADDTQATHLDVSI
jgi:hypothetical protein